jgi:hypothetical protein
MQSHNRDKLYGQTRTYGEVYFEMMQLMNLLQLHHKTSLTILVSSTLEITGQQIVPATL